MKDMIVFKTVKLSEKLPKEELEKLRMQTAHKFFYANTYPSLYDPMGYSYGYADCTSKFIIRTEQISMSQDTEPDISKSYYINGLQVSKGTFNDIYNDIWNILNSIDNMRFVQKIECNFPYSVITFVIAEEDYMKDIRGKRAESKVIDEWADIPIMKYINSKENENMPKIVNYKYNEETGTTTLFWADKTQTTVTADNLAEANQFEGFCAACAKKLFGNKSTYLNQFDKWTVKIPERERLAAEKKAKEDKEREEAKARKTAKKAERRAKREVELIAKEFADNYKHESVWEQAKKLAMKKYGVPADYFADDCHCNCKEFDVMDENENNISN